MRFIPNRWLTVMVSYGMFTEKEKVMSHPDPLYDDFDMQAERNIYPWCDDESHDSNYDDYEDFYDDENYDESMDGDHDSTMNSIGWDVDEGYGYYGEDY
jgi:hypothetical protein